MRHGVAEEVDVRVQRARDALRDAHGAHVRDEIRLELHLSLVRFQKCLRVLRALSGVF